MSDAIQPGVDRRIRAAAAHAGLSLQGLADELARSHPDSSGLSHANLKVLGIDRPPRIEHLANIADVTGMPLAYLTDGAQGLDSDETLREVRAIRAEVSALAAALKRSG